MSTPPHLRMLRRQPLHQPILTLHFVGSWYSMILLVTIVEGTDGKRFSLPRTEEVANSSEMLTWPPRRKKVTDPAIVLPSSRVISPLRFACRLSQGIVVASHYVTLLP